jgi:hypothetical protein
LSHNELHDNTAVFTCGHVLDDGKPVLRVVHDEDGDWQFLCGADRHETSDGRLICLGCAWERVGSHEQLSMMDTGMAATRDSVSHNWVISGSAAQTSEND